MMEKIKTRYPNEDIVVVSEETISISTNINNTSHRDGKKWHLKSNTTGFDFYAQDYMGSSTWTTMYELRDNYFDVYYLDFIEKLYDSKIKVTTYVVDDPNGITKISDTSFYLSDYNNSTSEIADAVFSLISKIKSDEKLTSMLPYYFYINIRDDEKCISSIKFDNVTSKEDILSIIESDK